MTTHLVPDDEDWMALLQGLEEPLLIGVSGRPDDEGWKLPWILTSHQPREAWWRIYQAVRNSLAEARQRRLLAASGRRELAPLALAELADPDVGVLATVAEECNRALAGLGSRDLAELLHEVAGGFDTGAEQLVRDLARVVATLRLRLDARTGAEDQLADVDVLTAAVRSTSGDETLTADQERAYGRFMRRWVEAMNGDAHDQALRLFAYGVE